MKAMPWKRGSGMLLSHEPFAIKQHTRDMRCFFGGGGGGWGVAMMYNYILLIKRDNEKPDLILHLFRGL